MLLSGCIEPDRVPFQIELRIHASFSVRLHQLRLIDTHSSHSKADFRHHLEHYQQSRLILNNIR